MSDRRPSSRRAIRKAAREANFRAADETDGHIKLGSHSCDFDIVAESRYKAQIEALLKAADRRQRLYDIGDWMLTEIRFWLVPEPSNAYDSNAVTVATGPDLSKALQVGYIARKQAAQLQPHLAEAMPVPGIIIGRSCRWGVKLDKPTMDELLAG